MRLKLITCWAASALLVASLGHAAEVSEVRFAEGFGLAYLPITVLVSEQLVDKRARELGAGPVTAVLRKITGGPAMIDALLSGQVDFISGGVPPLINLWDKTRGGLNVRALASTGNTPLHLNTVDPSVRTLADLVGRGKIALPAAKISIQALTLQMAAEKQFGADKFDILDRQTVSMPHPEAMQALLSARTEITSHFASMPFLWIEEKDPKVRTVLSSYDVVGGPHSGSVVYDTGKWKDQNPVNFMHRRGQIKHLPASWKELFWENMHDRDGS